MPEIRETDSDEFSLQGDLDKSMREMAKTRKVW